MAKLKKEIVDLADGLHSAAIHLLRQVRVEDRATGIGPAQLSALSVLVFGGSMSLGKLASAEQVKPPTMVRIVRSLLEQGLVRTRADKTDKRKIEIAATACGRTLMLRARQQRVEALARAVAALPGHERANLRVSLKILSKLPVILRRPVGNREPPTD
jgi:DNA-binding MarR family transcriptional regulator